MPRANRHSCLVTSGTSPIYAAASSSRSSGSIAFLRHPPLRIGAPFKASRADADSKFKVQGKTAWQELPRFGNSRNVEITCSERFPGLGEGAVGVVRERAFGCPEVMKGLWFYNFDWVKISIVIQFEEFFIPLFSKKLFYGNRVLRLQNLHLASRTVAPPYVVGR